MVLLAMINDTCNFCTQKPKEYDYLYNELGLEYFFMTTTHNSDNSHTNDRRQTLLSSVIKDYKEHKEAVKAMYERNLNREHRCNSGKMGGIQDYIKKEK